MVTLMSKYIEFSTNWNSFHVHLHIQAIVVIVLLPLPPNTKEWHKNQHIVINDMIWNEWMSTLEINLETEEPTWICWVGEMVSPRLRSVGSCWVLRCVREDAVEIKRLWLLLLLIDEEEFELFVFPIVIVKEWKWKEIARWHIKPPP